MENIKKWLLGGTSKTDGSEITTPEEPSHNRIEDALTDEKIARSEKEIFLLRSRSILRLLVDSTSEFKKNKMSLITSPYFDTSAITQMTTDETYNLLVSSEPHVTRDILSHSFPKQQDFNRLVKLIDDGDQEEYRTKILKKDNLRFYSYCRGVKCVNDIEQKLQDVSLLENILSPRSTPDDRVQKIDMLSCDAEWVRQLINPADFAFEPVITLYKLLLNLVAYLYKNAIVTDVQKQEICDMFSCSCFTEIFDVGKYIEEYITQLGINPQKKQASKKDIPLEELIVVKTGDEKDEKNRILSLSI